MKVAGVEPRRADDAPLRWLLLLGAVVTPFNFAVRIPAGDITIHPLQVWSVVFVAVTLTLRPRAFLEAADPTALLLWTMFAFVLLSTVFGTPDEYRTRGFLDASLLAINLAAFTITVWQLRRDPASWAPFARVLFGASIVSSSLLVVHALQVAAGGVFVQRDSYILGLGTVTGTFTAAFAAAAVMGMIFASQTRLRLLLIPGIVVHGMAASLSLARGPWLALAIAVAVTFPLVARTLPSAAAVLGAALRGVGALVLLAAPALGAVLLNASVTRLFAFRLLHVATLGSGTGLTRVNLFRALLDDAMDSPLFGHGAATYRRVSELLGTQASISENFLLEIFHAGGAMAALPLVLAATVILARVTRSLSAPTGRGLGAACLAGVLALILGALSNPAAWDTAFWILAALTAAAASAVSRPSPLETQSMR